MTTSNAEAAARRAAHGLIEHMGTCGGTGGGCSSLEDRLTAYILTTETRLAAAEEAVREARAGALAEAVAALEARERIAEGFSQLVSVRDVIAGCRRALQRLAVVEPTTDAWQVRARQLIEDVAASRCPFARHILQGGRDIIDDVGPCSTSMGCLPHQARAFLATSPLAEPPGEGEGALTPGTGRGGEP